ncbi:uncharacterized protein M6B38_382790 [Iris pallida]|uniref:Avr9/Cf-9 rapidly elicited protein 146 n=1 Tax=Iris pallida TaxID=29817 RepID=A0AAX6G6Q0_IRIPA|nr:uncharacterized protein M6B38_382790 [Iris pallida]
MKIENKNNPKASAKRLWSILRAVYYMLKEGIARHRLVVDLKLHILLERGKAVAGRSIPSLDGLSCSYVDPAKSYYDPREVEFSCSNTPFYAPKRRLSKQHRCCDYKDHVAAVARAFEMLNSEALAPGEEGSAAVTPSPMGIRRFRNSPAVVRKVRVTDSPFPLVEEGEEGSYVDEEAEEFIKRFYEQLRLQNKSLLGRK